MNDLDLRKLRLLRELERRETVSAVAEALYLTPSTVSQQLTSLGKELGVQLTEPVGRRIRLTNAAHVVLKHADLILAQMEELTADLAAYQLGDAGAVSVTGFAALLTSLVLPTVRSLKKERPGLHVKITETDLPASNEKLVHGETDIVISVAPVLAQEDDSRLSSLPLIDEVFDLALPVGHPFADASEVWLVDLAAEAWIFTAIEKCQEIPMAACAAAGFMPQVTHTMGTWDVTLSAVGMGMGICLVPRLSHPWRHPDVVIRPLSDAPQRRVCAVVRKGSQNAPEIAAVLASLQQTADKVADRILQASISGGKQTRRS